MIYRCDKCDTEMKLMKGAKYCPMCGNEIKPIDLEEKVAALYNSGKTANEIATELRMSDIVISQTLSKAAVNGNVSPEGLIQEEYGPAIKAVMDDNWDGMIKTVKKAMPEDCTYTTINYFARKNRREHAIERREKNEKRANEIRSMLKSGTSIEQIAETMHVSVMMIERIMVEEIRKDKAIANPYINNEYKTQIMDAAGDPAWDGKLRTIKEKLPDEVTYTNIKATIAKYQ